MEGEPARPPSKFATECVGLGLGLELRIRVKTRNWTGQRLNGQVDIYLEQTIGRLLNYGRAMRQKVVCYVDASRQPRTPHDDTQHGQQSTEFDNSHLTNCKNLKKIVNFYEF